ncbi:MAG: D-alanine--D-alanine ligase family protein [Erysipelotrichaceae bacterium]
MSKIRLAVIFGGNSSEYSVSLHSVASVLRSIDNDKYDITLIGINQAGSWFLYNGDIDDIEHDNWEQESLCTPVILSPNPLDHGFIVLNEGNRYDNVIVDVCFPVMHGQNSEDGTIQGLFTMAKMPYVGCGVLASSTCMDKVTTHIICESADIKMAPYISLLSYNNNDYKKIYKDCNTKLGEILFIKPANAGSSYGISKVRTYEEFIKGVEFAFFYDKKIIIEAAIDGFELGCAVKGNDIITIGELDEIDTKNDFFDFEGKYELTNTQIHCPARINKTLTKKAKEMAVIAYKAMGCNGLSRVDMFVSNNDIILNEINTIPGFTDASRYPTMMKTAGTDFKTLIDELINLALNK